MRCSLLVCGGFRFGMLFVVLSVVLHGLIVGCGRCGFCAVGGELLVYC